MVEETEASEVKNLDEGHTGGWQRGRDLNACSMALEQEGERENGQTRASLCGI